MWKAVPWVWAIGSLLLLVLDHFSETIALRWVSWLYLLAIVICSPIAFGLYGLDKYKAQRDRWRIPEATLHLWSLAGGWPGGWIAQKTFRHKTRKQPFQTIFRTIVAAHLVLTAGYIAWRLFGNS